MYNAIPPANIPYYLCVTESAIVVAASLLLASDKVPVIRLVSSVVPSLSMFSTPLVILIASIAAVGVSSALYDVIPPANIPYYIFVSMSVIVVAARLLLPTDNPSVDL